MIIPHMFPGLWPSKNLRGKAGRCQAAGRALLEIEVSRLGLPGRAGHLAETWTCSSLF